MSFCLGLRSILYSVVNLHLKYFHDPIFSSKHAQNPLFSLLYVCPFPRPVVAGDSLTISDNSQGNTNSVNLIEMQEEIAFKILLVGNLGVGKSSLLLRYAEGSFKEDLLPTVGVDFRIRTVQQAGSAVHLQLWDTAGQQRMNALSAGFYRRAHGLLVVFDLSDRKSFLDVRGWLQQAKLYGSGQAVGVLVGNKNDLSRVVSREQAEKLAVSEGMRYFEVSAKTNSGVEEAFSSLSSFSMKGFSEAYIAKYKKTQTYLQSTKGNTTTKQSCC